MNLRTRLLGGAVALAAACSGGGGTEESGNDNNPTNNPPPQQPPGTPAQSANVVVLDDYFSPNSVLVAAGGTVTWTWQGDNGHSVTPEAEGSFSPSAPISYPPKTLTVTFPTTGRYDYFCTAHGSPAGYGGSGSMVGSIFVQ